jgi:hypothetical protein
MREFMLDPGDGADPFPPPTGEGVETSEFIEHGPADPHEAEGPGFGGGTVETERRIDESLAAGGGQIIAIDMSRESGRDTGQSTIDQIKQFDRIGRGAGWAEGIWCYHDETPAGGLGFTWSQGETSSGGGFRGQKKSHFRLGSGRRIRN